MKFFLFFLISFLLFFSSPSFPAGTEGDAGQGRRVFDLRLSGGIGYFYYPQKVEEGFYVNGRPYDLTWSGKQAQWMAEAHLFLPWIPQVSAGLGGGNFRALNPVGRDAGKTVRVDPGGNANGGFGGISASYWIADAVRLNLLAGYGGTGIGEYYGGTGMTYSAGLTFLLNSDSVLAGLGARLLVMKLKHPGDADTRPEKGPYYAFLLEASVDWAPKY